MTAQGGAAPFNPPQDFNNNNPFDNDNNTFMPQPPPNPNAQPAVIQTPFGPIQNPNRPVQGQVGQQQPNGPTPMVLPGQTTTGGASPIKCHGHKKSDAMRMKQLIEQYQTEYYKGRVGDVGLGDRGWSDRELGDRNAGPGDK